MTALRRGHRVRYLNDRHKPLGVVADESGRQFVVRFDDGSSLTFENDPDSTPPVERVLWDVGNVVILRDTKERVEIVRVAGTDTQRIYKVLKGDGKHVSVSEEDLCESPEAADPLANLKAGRLDSADDFELSALARRLHHAYHYQNLSSLSSARIDIQPHQVAVLHRVVQTYPHRFLLADEVGLGKTIEAGLIIKEMKARGMARRILILTPPGITLQWLGEMHHKFNELFKYYSHRRIEDEQAETPDTNVWAKHDQIVAPITAFTMVYDRVRREDLWDDVAEAGWDLVIVDEAHHMRRHYRGDDEPPETTRAYQLGERLREAARFMLFLTATPQQLHPFELFSLVELLDPGRFADYRDFEEKRRDIVVVNRAVQRLERHAPLGPAEAEQMVADLQPVLGEATPAADGLADPTRRDDWITLLERSHHLSDVMIRNRKARIGGFKRRLPHNHSIAMSDNEALLYSDITEWLRSLNRTVGKENRAIGFMLVTFQRLLASSPRALAAAFEKRVRKLQDPEYVRSVYDRLQKRALRRLGEGITVEALEAALAGADDGDEELDVGDALAQCGIYAPTLDDLGAQIRSEIESLSDFLSRMRRLRRDSKLQTLLEVLGAIEDRGNSEKVVVFTQYYETQNHIAEAVQKLYGARGLGDASVLKFNGRLSTEEKNRVVNRFRNEPNARVLVLTESGGEGRNLQFSHVIVNYDLPWNPMRVEQRIGRLDRLTQECDVEIHNLALRDTIEDRILTILHKRIRLFEETVGGLDPILEKIEGEIAEASMDPSRFQRLEVSVQNRVHGAREAEQRLADVIMDRKSFRRESIDRLLKERVELNRADLERFFKRFCRTRDLGYAEVERGVLRIRTGRHTKSAKLPAENRTYFVTFDTDIARTRDDIDFLGFGHALFDAAVAECMEEPAKGAGTRVVEAAVECAETGALFQYEVTLGGIRHERRALPIYVSDTVAASLEIGGLVARTSPRAPPPGVTLENILETAKPRLDSWAGQAEDLANAEMLAIKDARVAEQDRLFEAERAHLEKYFEHKTRELKRGLRHAVGTHDRIAGFDSDDPRRKILPTWEKRVEDATDALGHAEKERAKRLEELESRKKTDVRLELVQAAAILRVPASVGP